MKAPKSLQVQIKEENTDSCWRWVVCVASFSLQFLVGGLHSSFGTFFVALLDKYGGTEAETAWVGSLAIGITYFTGPLSTYLCHRFGCRIVACAGSVLLAVSGFLTSLANNILCMYFTFGVLNGLASSMLYFTSLVVLIEYFHKDLSLANGIAVSGVGVGTLVINMLSQYLISNYGLAMTFRVVAGFSAVAFVAGLAYSPLKIPREPEKPLNFTKEDTAPAETSTSFVSKCKKFCKIGKHWRNKGFLVWTMAMALILFAYYIPAMYLLKIAKDIGVPPSKGGLLIAFMFISQTMGKLIMGKLADLRSANRLIMMQLSLLVVAVAGCLLPLAKSYGALVTYSVVQGFFDGSFVVLIGLITHDIVGKALMADAVGCIYTVISLPMTLGPPVAGMFYDVLGNYNVIFFLCSGLVCAGICITFFIPWLTPPTLTYLDYDKQVLLSKENDIDNYHEDDRQYDMSYVDEQKLADLFGKQKGINHFLERNRSQLDFSSVSRPSSFVLFTIVSDGHPRDISAYASRQELAFTSAATTPLRGTPGTTRRKYHDVESYTSMYSLRQSFADVTYMHPEIETPDNSDCTEPTTVPLIQRDKALATVEEGNEGERKQSGEEKRSSPLESEIMKVKAQVSESVDNSVAQEEERESSLCFTEKEESWKSSSESTARTIDSGYVEYADTSSSEGKLSSTSILGDANTHYSGNGLNENKNTEVMKDQVYHSYSCSDVTELPELSYICINPIKTLREVKSVELIDNRSCSYETYAEFPSLERGEPRCEIELKAGAGLICSTKSGNLSTEDGNADRKRGGLCVNCKYSNGEDMFSLLVEEALELEEGGTEYLNSYKTSYKFENGNLYGGKYRETVV